MSLAIGIGGGNPTSGGGTPSLTDPSSFADAYALWRSDAGITTVDVLNAPRISVWADQSGNGFNIIGNGSNNYPYFLSKLKSPYNFEDIYSAGLSDQCRATGLSGGPYTEFSYDFIWYNRVAYNPAGYMPCTANVNSSDRLLLCYMNTTQLVVQCGTTTDHILNQYTLPEGTTLTTIKGTLIWDGNEGTASDRIKFYRAGSLVSPTVSSTIGTAPTSVTLGYGQFNFSSSTTARKNNVSSPYMALWNRALTTDEITANNTWKDEIYNDLN